MNNNNNNFRFLLFMQNPKKDDPLTNWTSFALPFATDVWTGFFVTLLVVAIWEIFYSWINFQKINFQFVFQSLLNGLGFFCQQGACDLTR